LLGEEEGDGEDVYIFELGRQGAAELWRDEVEKEREISAENP
jgi:hypothetical protein